MVDSGFLVPESVADLTQRQRRHPGGEPAPAQSHAQQAEDYLSLPFLMERVESAVEQVRMWAAYHLLDRWPHECARFVENLWRSPTAEIRDCAVTLIGRYGLERYAFPLLRLFLSNEGGLGAAAAQALGRLRYESAAKLLLQRFEALLTDLESNTLELEALAESLLLFDNRAYWPLIHGRLARCQQNHALFSTLFRLLSRHVETNDQLALLAQAYREPREVFHDAHLTQHLVLLIGRPNLSRYLQLRLNGGYPLNTIYQECLQVLGADSIDPEVSGWIQDLAACKNSRGGMEKFLPIARKLIERLAPDRSPAASHLAFLEGCRAWIGRWEEAILKVREAEYHLLISLPLAAVLVGVERACLAQPEQEALRIMHIYQSPLLAPDFMAEVLALVATHLEQTGEAGPAAVPWQHGSVGWHSDEEKDALWRLFTRQLDGVDYPFEQVLPQPWGLGVPHLMERLSGVLVLRFSQYLKTGRNQAVDYCLEVFRRGHGEPPVDLLLHHFDGLINQHYHAFVEFMTHLPDGRFLPGLLRHYREGESDLQRLIRFICDVQNLPYPPAILGEAEESPGNGLATLRLSCPRCGGTYHYDLSTLYVDEERIEQRQVPQARDLWAPHAIQCKKCASPVPFDPEARFLSDLFAELLASRLFTVPEQEGAALKRVHLIPFPALDGKTLNPGEFLLRAQARLAQCTEPGQEVPILAELGKFHLEVGNLKEAKQAFQRILAGPVRYPLALYYLGVIAFQEKNLFEARVHFSRLTEGYTREEFDNALDNPVEMAHHYLKLLEKREFKRSHFHLLST